VVLLVMGAMAVLVLGAVLYAGKAKADLIIVRNSLLKDNQELRARTEMLQDALNQKEEALRTAENDKRAFEDQAATLKQQNDKMRSESDQMIEDLTKKKAALKKKIENMKKAPLDEWLKTVMQNEGNQKIKSILNDAATKINMVKHGQSVTLEPIEVSAANRKGNIISIDRKNDLIIVSIGTKDGVMEGERCSIYSGEGKEIATCEIISARYTIAAAFVDNMNYGTNIKNIKEGLTVAIVEK